MDPGRDRPRVPRTAAGGVPDSHLRAGRSDHRARWYNLRELRFLDQLFYRPAPRLRVGWLTIERPAISHFDMAGLFTPYLSRNIPTLPIAIGGTLRGHWYKR